MFEENIKYDCRLIIHPSRLKQFILTLMLNYIYNNSLNSFRIHL